MGKVCERPNLQATLKRVRRNKGSPGIDGMTVDELPNHLREGWPRLREQLLAGTYQPARVKEQLIPKASGGMRKLGIPTVVDRFIQRRADEVPLANPNAGTACEGGQPWTMLQSIFEAENRKYACAAATERLSRRSAWIPRGSRSSSRRRKRVG